ncbi:MAG: hypothetical protein O7D30_05400, partial [Rickettsia endosymbiont of Ixodes persulcatus]|nr:hypothetical protein [Rickettsia endosymbiont of Ixodes persulcatus]
MAAINPTKGKKCAVNLLFLSCIKFNDLTPMQTERSHLSSSNRAPFGTGDKRWRKRSRRQLPPTNEQAFGAESRRQ